MFVGEEGGWSCASIKPRAQRRQMCVVMYGARRDISVMARSNSKEERGMGGWRINSEQKNDKNNFKDLC